LASVFHPGTRDVAAATPVTVTRGEERLGVDLVMPLTSTASIEGRVIDAAGRPATGVIVSFSDGFGTSSRNAADGTFSVRNLLSGRYVVSAREGTTAWATAEVALGRSDIRDLTLTLQPTLTIRGRAVIDAMSTPGAPPDLLTLRQLPQGSGLPPRSPIGPDGTFQIGGIAPGRFMWAVSSSTSAGAPPWIIKSAMVRGRDVADLPFEIGPGSALADVAITLSNLTGEVVGTLRDGSGLPIAGYSVLVFAADTTYWTARSPRLPAPVRTATDGTYRVPGLPDGQYYLAAFTELEAREIGETFLSSAAASSLRVSITAGERTVQDIVLGAPAHAPR
jgi:hypothetical protein